MLITDVDTINVVFILSGKRVFISFVTVVREKNGLKALL